MSEQVATTVGGEQGADTAEQQKQPEQQQADPKAELQALKRENEALKGRVTETEESARYWHSQAKGNPAKGRAEEQGDGTPKPEDDETDMLELAGKGPAAMKDWLKKSGFMSAAEVQNITNAKASQLVREAQLTQRYPDLQDKDSEFFKATASEYQSLKARGVPEVEAMELAAERAELASLRTGKATAAASPASTGGGSAPKKKTETEEERAARIAAQAGGGGRRLAKGEDETDELTPEQQRIAEAFGITGEAYKKRAKDGVQVARQL